MAEFPELELRIARLPPLSRGIHLAGPRLHAERLIALWRSDDPVPLGEAFRLLVDVDMVAGAILRTIANSEHGYPDPRHWRFPDLEGLLPELRACAWQEILAGRLLVETSGRALTPATLTTLKPDWPASRLLRPTKPLIKVTVRPLPPVPINRTWRKPLPADAVEAAVGRIVERLQAGEQPTANEFWKLLVKELPGITWRRSLQALKAHAPHLVRGRGYRRLPAPKR